MECALFRKDYDMATSAIGNTIFPPRALWNVPCLERITTCSFRRRLPPDVAEISFMECALFRKDYDDSVVWSDVTSIR